MMPQSLIALIVAAAALAADPVEWEFLGSRKAGRGHDRDEIVVTAKEGRFEQIQLRVRVAPVRIHDVKVHFGNEEIQDVQVRREIRPGGVTRAIDLVGDKRIIRKVVFWYKTAPRARRSATVELWGH